MDFTKTQCDGCGRPFEKEDDIVVCPVCGTPQHRECYELAGGCVNAAKHELGFEFDPPESDEKEEAKAKEEAERKTRAAKAVNESLSLGEFPDVNDVIEQRVSAICPGITEQQRKEQVCGVELGLASAFVGNGAERYINKFRKMEQIGKRTFNWAAFLFTPYWFFWRKLFKEGLILAGLDICASLLMNYFVRPILPVYQSIVESGETNLTEAEFSAFYSVGLKLLILYGVIFAIHLFVGFFADKIYHNYCTKTLNEFHQKKASEENEESLRFFLTKSSTSIAATIASILVTYFVPSILSNLLFK